MSTPRTLAALALLAALLFGASNTRAQEVPSNTGVTSSTLPPVLQNVGFDPPLNGQMPLDVPFTDETGQSVKLSEYFGHSNKPVLLAFVYYGCPVLCNQLEQGVVGSLKMLSFNPGRDYDVVFISFDPRENSSMAAQKKESAVGHFGRPATADGWHFLTGSPESIATVTHAANFRYNQDPRTSLFSHASGIMLLTPDGRISRYFYGIEFPARDLRLGLVDASAGKIGSPVDRVLLYCFQYDPASGKYSAAILKIMRLGGVLTVLCIVMGILVFRRRDHLAAPQGAH
jgi:protein SCO1/2